MSRELTDDEMRQLANELDSIQYGSVESTLSAHDRAQGHADVWTQVVKMLGDWCGNSAIRRLTELNDSHIPPDKHTVGGSQVCQTLVLAVALQQTACAKYWSLVIKWYVVCDTDTLGPV